MDATSGYLNKPTRTEDEARVMFASFYLTKGGSVEAIVTATEAEALDLVNEAQTWPTRAPAKYLGSLKLTGAQLEDWTEKAAAYTREATRDWRDQRRHEASFSEPR